MDEEEENVPETIENPEPVPQVVPELNEPRIIRIDLPIPQGRPNLVDIAEAEDEIFF